MDNVTHTVVGLLLGEAALALRSGSERSRRAPQSERLALRSAALWVSILANNAPDADSFYASAITRPLGSLLHHRGHTHTFAMALPLAALVLAVVLALMRRHAFLRRPNELGFLAGLSLAGNLLHVGLDATNNYGVHPFWPFDNRWFYGDAVFIVEPLLWSALIPPLVFGVRTRAARLALAAIVALGATLTWYFEFVPRSMALVTTLFAFVTGYLGYRASAAGRVLVSGAAALAVVSAFVVASSLVNGAARRVLDEEFPQAKLEDLVLTPLPANPLCWQAIAIQTEGSRYVARVATAAALPGLMAASDCPADPFSEPTAPVRALDGPSRHELRFVREYSADTAELRRLAGESCVFSALLIFARAPYATELGPLAPVAGDLRYDRSPDLDFSDVSLAPGVPCPKRLPPWTPPRAGLFAR